MTKPKQPIGGWRGVVVSGVVFAWPSVLLSHDEAFEKFAYLKRYSCRWRQWNANGPIDFDPGCSDKDKTLVEDWIRRVTG